MHNAECRKSYGLGFYSSAGINFISIYYTYPLRSFIISRHEVSSDTAPCSLLLAHFTTNFLILNC